jgi:hypothetical protein
LLNMHVEPNPDGGGGVAMLKLLGVELPPGAI